MPQPLPDSVSSLSEEQLQAWQQDPDVAGAIMFILGPNGPSDIEVTKTGKSPQLEQAELANILARASEEEASGWVVNIGGQAGRVYPIKANGSFHGIWVVTGEGGGPPPDRWQYEATRYANELFRLRGSRTTTPSLAQLVDAIPALASSQPEQMSPLHWEKSQARVEVAVQDELENCLINDQMPIF